MIYNYEASVLMFIHSVEPQIKLATYASSDEVLSGLAPIKEFPAFYYFRTNQNIHWNKPIVVPATVEHKATDYLYPYEQTYEGTILVENQQAAFRLISALKFAFQSSASKVQVFIPGISDPTSSERIAVQLWPLSFSTSDIRVPGDKNGACRAVHFQWKSNLFLNTSIPTPQGVVEQVQLAVNNSALGTSSTSLTPSASECHVGFRKVNSNNQDWFEIYCTDHVN